MSHMFDNEVGQKMWKQKEEKSYGTVYNKREKNELSSQKSMN